MNHGSKEHLDTSREAIPVQRPLALSHRVVRQWTAATGVLIAYVALEWVSFIHESNGLPLTPWNPGLGIVFACLILLGPHYGIVLFAGIIVAETSS